MMYTEEDLIWYFENRVEVWKRLLRSGLKRGQHNKPGFGENLIAKTHRVTIKLLNMKNNGKEWQKKEKNNS